MTYQVWIEGFAATGDRARAQFLGEYSGKDFRAACRSALISHGWTLKGYYNPVQNTYWGCRFYENEAEARRSFG